MEYIKKKIGYYFYDNNEKSTYIFDIKSEEDIGITIKKRVGFDIEQKVIEPESVFNYKYFLTLFISILLLSVKILYTNLYINEKK